MGPGATPADEGYFIYVDACLTTLWFGEYEYGGSIYSASQIVFEGNVGDPC